MTFLYSLISTSKPIASYCSPARDFERVAHPTLRSVQDVTILGCGLALRALHLAFLKHTSSLDTNQTSASNP